MHQVYLSKKKYKNRYKEIKQKLDILQEVYKVQSKRKNIYVETSEYYNAQHHGSLRFEGQNVGVK